MNRRLFFNRMFGALALIPATAVARPAPMKYLKPSPSGSGLGEGKLSKPLTLLITELAGFQYYAGEKLWPAITPGDALWLMREPANPHDNQAGALFWQGFKIGYVPRRDNTVIAQLLDRDTPLQCNILEKNKSDDPWQRIKFEISLTS